MTTDVHARLLAVLARRLSTINAQNVLARALRDVRVTATSLSTGDVRHLVPVIERGLRLFLPPPAVAEVVTDLHRTFAPSEPPAPQRFEIETEADVSKARLTARDLCQQLGARRVVAQKAATVVSELARNIYMYTPGGTIDLIPAGGAPPRLLIRAIDAGSGIPNLDEVLGGTYRSRTGLGAGLLGTKRLADRFAIETGATGTRIDAELHL